MYDESNPFGLGAELSFAPRIVLHMEALQLILHIRLHALNSSARASQPVRFE